jgi:hypothetical protein
MPDKIEFNHGDSSWYVGGKKVSPFVSKDVLQFPDGRSIPIAKLTEQLGPEVTNQWITPEAEIKPPQIGGQEDIFGSRVSNILESVRSKLPKPIADLSRRPGVLLGLAGATINPMLAIAGGALGNLAEQQQAGEVNPLETAVQTGIDLGGIYAGEIPTRLLASKLSPRLVGSYTPGTRLFSKEAGELAPTLREKAIAVLGSKLNKSTPEEIASLYEQVPGTTTTYLKALEPTVGEITGSGFAQFVENALENRGISNIQAGQKIKVGELIGQLRGRQLGTRAIQKEIPQEILGKEIQEGMRAGRESLKGEQRVIWNGIRSVLDENKVTVPVVVGKEPSTILDAAGNATMQDIVEPRTFRGLIDTTNTQSVLGKYKDMIEGIFSEDKIKSMPDRLAAKYNLVKQTLLDFSEPTTIKLEGGASAELYKKEFEVAKNIRTSIEGILRNKKAMDWTFDEKILGEISSALGQDIEKGAEQFGISDLLTTANKLRKKQQEIYPSNVTAFIERNRYQDAYSSEIIPKVIGSSERTREIWNATPLTQRPIIKASAFEKAIETSSTAKPNSFDADKFYNTITDANSGYRVIFSPDELKNFKDFANAVGKVSEPYRETGKTAFEIRRASIALNAGAGVVSSLARGGPTAGLITGALGNTIIFSAKDFAKAFLKPGVAKLSIELAKVDPTSQKAKLMTKALLYSLRGTRVMMGINPDFMHPGFVNDQGQVQKQD